MSAVLEHTDQQTTTVDVILRNLLGFDEIIGAVAVNSEGLVMGSAGMIETDVDVVSPSNLQRQVLFGELLDTPHFDRYGAISRVTCQRAGYLDTLAEGALHRLLLLPGEADLHTAATPFRP